MSIVYAVEPLASARPDVEPFLPKHWQEIGLNRDTIRLNVNWERYEELENAGLLVIITARDEGRLIGYYVGNLWENPHYKGSPIAFTDVYFILPEYRGRGVGSGLFRFVEQVFREKGAVLMATATKLHADAGHLFKHLGWTEVERVFTKYIGEEA